MKSDFVFGEWRGSNLVPPDGRRDIKRWGSGRSAPGAQVRVGLASFANGIKEKWRATPSARGEGGRRGTREGKGRRLSIDERRVGAVLCLCLYVSSAPTI